MASSWLGGQIILFSRWSAIVLLFSVRINVTCLDRGLSWGMFCLSKCLILLIGVCVQQHIQSAQEKAEQIQAFFDQVWLVGADWPVNKNCACGCSADA